jgi:acetyl-CoA carboxylase carboxyl transferase subunit beta
MAWFRKDSEPQTEQKKVRTEGLWIKCDECRATVWKKDLEANQLVCTKCGFHFKMDARSRLKLLFDDERWEEFDTNLKSTDALRFVDQKPYRERLEKAEASTGLKDALISAAGKLGGHPTIICAMEYRFIGGSMGAVVGEKITRAIERAITRKIPITIVSASGGAC